jgi:hypothetical protein
MNNQRIVYTNDDGVCCIIIPADECGLSIIDIAMKDVPEGKSYRIIDVSQLPSDRIFRNAWTDEYDTDTVDIHLDKAKNIKLDMLRSIRKPILDQLDISFMKSIELNNDSMKQDIINKKQALRDITKIALPDDIDELKIFMPDILG